MLYSTNILLQLSNKITVARDWRVVSVLEEDSKVIRCCCTLEPFVPTPADSTASIRAVVCGSQQGSFQDLPLDVCVADAVQFGLYLIF